MNAPRYVVTSVFFNVPIYEGDNRERAVEVANFWDERGNVTFLDREHLSPLEWANHQFDTAIRSL